MHTTIIDALTALEENVKYLDCRSTLGDPDAGRRAFEAGHIAGAQFLSLDDDLAATPGDDGRHPLPAPESLINRLQALGISDSDQVVVYDDAGGAYAARAWWCLRWLGHEPVAVLNGGLKAWPAPLTTEVIRPPAGNFSQRPSLTRSLAVEQLTANSGDYSLIDARAQARFDGLEEPIDPVAGHIPGASCLPFQDNLADNGTFLSPEKLKKRFPEGANVVCYCGSGVTAAHNILAMRIAGLPEPILYPGSWSEWIVDPTRPVATAANPEGKAPG